MRKIWFYLLPLLKLHAYNAREYGTWALNNFWNEFSKIKNLEEREAENNWNKYERFRKSWHRIENKVP